MQDNILYQCQLTRVYKSINSVYELLLYSKKIKITQNTPFGHKEQILDITSSEVQLTWEKRGNVLKGFNVSFLSNKTGQIKRQAYRGEEQDIQNLKKVLDGKAFYNQFTDHYQLLDIILNRKDSQIQKCLNRQTGALKIAKKLHYNTNQKRIPAEVYVAMKLKQYPHKYILSIDEVFVEEDGVYLVMDNCEGGTLFNYFVSRNFDIPILQKLKIMRRILKAVHHLHDNEIMHRDLKFDNILFSCNEDLKSLKIIDLGLAKYVDNKVLTMCGTPGYIAPEILNGQPYNQLCDIYSLGCLFHSLLAGERLFPEYVNKNHLYQLNKQNSFKISERIQDYHAKDLILKMLKPETQRPSAFECLNHPFFQRRVESTHSISNKLKLMDFPLMKNPFTKKPIAV